MINNKFRKIAKFYFKDGEYQLFLNQNDKMSFLRLDNGKYYYPELGDVIDMVKIFAGKTEHQRQEIKKDSKKIQFYTFVPKVMYAGALLTITASLLAGCARKSNNYTALSSVNFSQETSTENNTSKLEDEIVEDVDSKYLSYLAPADDEFDFQYKSDYEDFSMVKILKARDSSGLDQIFGSNQITVEDIRAVCEQNPKIPEKYKDFIVNYVTEWEQHYPNSDFRILYHNLKTLELIEATESQIIQEAMAYNALAVYLRSENKIYVQQDLDISKDSEGYIILTHELSHAMRGADYYLDDGTRVILEFYEYYRMGKYTEEALINYFAYEMQGLNKKSIYYPLQSNYFRIILNSIDYTGTDFTRHSINYLMDKMDEYMGDEQYAYHIIALIDAQASLHFTSYAEVDFTEFDELYDYILRIYLKNKIYEGMNYEEAQEVFNAFIEEVFYGINLETTTYNMSVETFEGPFNDYLEELGISRAKTK